MKLHLLSFVPLSCALSTYGQQAAPQPCEVGVNVVSYVPSESVARTKLHGPSGIFLRYTPQHLLAGRVDLRAGAGFTQRVSGPLPACRDCPQGETSARTLTLRAGGQYEPLRHLPWLYAFADGAYRYTAAAGDYIGGLCGCLDFTET